MSATTQPQPVGGAPRTSAGSVAAIVAGAIVALIAFGLLVGGAGLVGAHLFARDADGYYSSPTETLRSNGYAVTGEGFQIGDVHAGAGEWALGVLDGRVRVRAAATGGGSIFVGIARQSDVDRYLGAAAHDEVTDVNGSTIVYRSHPGSEPPAAPATQRFWEASASGTGRQAVEWKVRSGRWAVVVMNASATRGVDARVSIAGKSDILLWIGLGLLGAGVMAAGVAAALLIVGIARSDGPGASAQVAPATASPAPGPEAPAEPSSYPVAVDARLDEPLSRWLWLAKWLLAIPHYIVLAFLWLAYVVLTAVAFFAILFTGRYPRSIFDFNVGVLRWSWRVGFYAYSALGTDRYPPFSLGEEPDYPARLAVAYPAHLSRGLVLIKWWLLAIPQYIVAGILVGSWSWPQAWWPWTDANGLNSGPIAAGSPGLIGILVLIAGVVLLAGRRYPREIFDLVIGFNRWVFRVIAYASLMRDEYPPFSLRR